MRGVKNFKKYDRMRRILSIVMSALMLISTLLQALPEGAFIAYAAESYSVKLHCYNAKGWDSVNAWIWDTDNNYSGGNWPGVNLMTDGIPVEGRDGWYDYDIPAVSNSILKVILSGGGTQTEDLSVDLSYVLGDTKEIWVSSDGVMCSAPPASWNGGNQKIEESSVTIHCYNTSNWSNVYAYLWDSEGTKLNGEWSESEITQNAVPKKADWYDITVSNVTNSALNVILHNGNGSQTRDLSVDLSAISDTQKEIWVIAGNKGSDQQGNIFTTAPQLWTETGNTESPAVSFQGKVKFHFKNESAWSDVKLYTWDSFDNKLTGDWSGTALQKNSANENWYDIETELNLSDSKLNLIFNDGSVQTGNLAFTFTEGITDVWVTGGANATSENISSVAPDGWQEGGESTLKSPLVNGKEVTFYYQNDTADAVYIRGSFCGWNDGDKVAMQKEDSLFSYTTTLAAGKYQYKYYIATSDTWLQDPLNPNMADGNSTFIISGLYDYKTDAVKGNDVTLPDTLEYMDENGNVTQKNVTYRIPEGVSDVTLNGKTVNVSTDSLEKEICLIATAEDDVSLTSKVTLNLVDAVYKYTIYAYSAISDRNNRDNTGLYLWDKAEQAAEYTFTSEEKLSDGRTWLKYEIELSAYKELGFILKNKGDWSWQTSDLIFKNSAKTDQTLYLVDGYNRVYTHLEDVPKDRWLYVEYSRDDASYEDTYAYVWGNGYTYKENDVTKNLNYPVENQNGKYVVKIPIVSGTTDKEIGFIMQKGTDLSNKDGDDNKITVSKDAKITKVRFSNGKITSVVPENIGYTIDKENKTIQFFYRDETLSALNNLESLQNVQLVLRTATGTNAVGAEINYPMTYSFEHDRFESEQITLTTDTDYYYYYLVDGTVKTDSCNTRKKQIDSKTYSLCRNKVYNVNLNASVEKSSMDYNDNNVLYISVSGDETEGFTPETIYVDLSELGLDSKTKMDTELMALSFGCLESTTVGEKTIGITLIDDCSMEYKTTAKVTVTERKKTADSTGKLGDFDWDEAVIYFAVTDRFFDGNETNNTGDAFNKSDEGSYHGGDFAGLTQKIDYLYDLGVNTIWITPIVQNIEGNMYSGEGTSSYYAYHGYWASDFTKLNAHLGTEDEFKALIEAAHKKGMKVMVDVVLNHSGYGTEKYFNSILNGKSMLRDENNTVSGDTILDGLYGLPDFVTEDEDVRNQLIEWQTDWVKKYGIDYYRVDTVKHVESTTWSAFKNALTKISPDFKMIGEYYDAGYVNDFGQLDSGKMDSVLDFDFNDIMLKLVEEDLTGIEEALTERNAGLSNTATLGSFTSSHDEAGLLYTMEKSKGDWANALMRVAATYQITAKGQPVIYYGEELGLSGDSNYPSYDNRYDFNWTEQTKQASDTSSMYHHYKTLLNIRRTYSEVFAKGTRIQVVSPLVTDKDGNSIKKGYEVFARSYDGQTVYVGTNVWADAKTTKLYVNGEVGSTYTDLYNNKTYTVDKDGSITITIPGANYGGTAILVGNDKSVTDKNEITIKLHYTRTNNDYTDWNVWAWTEGLGGKGYELEEENGEKVATITVDGRTTNKVYYIIRQGEWKAKDHDGKDQYIDVSDITSGTVHFYVEQGVFGGVRMLGQDAVAGNKIVSAVYDRNTNKVTVSMASEIAGSTKDVFEIMCTSSNTKIGIRDIEEDGNVYTLTLAKDISSLTEMLKSYSIKFDGFSYNLTTPNVYSSEEFEKAYTYDGDDLGLTYTDTKSVFKLWAPTADSVTLNIYTGGTKGTKDLEHSYSMTKKDKGVWSYELSGDWNGKYYTYTVHVENEDNEICDPYARTTGVNGNRAMILDLDSTNPEGWEEDTGAHKDMNYTDAVIYELHVRDLSSDSSSGVSKEHQGKFLGLTETGTTTEGGKSTVLDHLIELGVTHLHLLPIYDYASVDEADTTKEQFNWGYDPLNYNVPEGSYATDAYHGEVRVSEMKQMVQTLHNNNINVIMDVVYNHVYDAGSFCFNQAVPKYFSRTNADGSYSNGSGCGNDTASERSMVHKYIVDSILYWHEEYHIDGFRFDLVGLLDTDTINEIVDSVHAIDPDIIFYGEGWTMNTAVSKDNVTMATQQNASFTPNFAYFSDTFRDGVAGKDTNGYGLIWGNGDMNTMAACYLGNPSWCDSPSQTINYASCHDNYTLMDKINEVSKANVTDYDTVPGAYQVKLNNLTAAYYMFAEGIPLIHAGEDFLRIKLDENGEIIHNSYNASDYVNKLRWYNLDTKVYADASEYYKGLIAFRKNHASLRLSTKALVDKNVSYYKVQDNVMLYKFKGKLSVSEEVADEIITIYNASSNDCQINLYNNRYGITTGEWKVCVNGEKAGTDVLATIADGKVTVPAHTAMALVLGETTDENSVYAKNNKVSVKFTQEDISIRPKDSITLKADVNLDKVTLKWESDDVSIAEVDENGTVTAKKEGTVTITVSTLHGVSASCQITVDKNAIRNITLDKTEMKLEVGETGKIKITSNISGTVHMTSDNKKVAEVDADGTVLACAEGTAVITVSADGYKNATCTVTVIKKSESNEPTPTPPTEDEPTPTPPTEDEPTPTPPTEDEPTQTPPTEDEPTQTPPTEDEPTPTPPTEDEPTPTPPTEDEVTPTPPTEDEPTPTPPTEDEPTQTPPTEDEPTQKPSTEDRTDSTLPTDKTEPTTPVTPNSPTKNDSKKDTQTVVRNNPENTYTTETADTQTPTEVIIVSDENDTLPKEVSEVTVIARNDAKENLKAEVEKVFADLLKDTLEEGAMEEETVKAVRQLLENNSEIFVEVLIENISEAEIDSEIKDSFLEALQKYTEDNGSTPATIAQYIDLSVWMTDAQEMEIGQLHKLKQPITMTIAVPEELKKEGRIFVVLRMHNDETSVLETVWNEDGTLSFETDRFSTYALAYVDKTVEEDSGDTDDVSVPEQNAEIVEKGSNGFMFVLLGVAGIAIAAGVALIFVRKNKKK